MAVSVPAVAQGCPSWQCHQSWQWLSPLSPLTKILPVLSTVLVPWLHLPEQVVLKQGASSSGERPSGWGWSSGKSSCCRSLQSLSSGTALWEIALRQRNLLPSVIPSAAVELFGKLDVRPTVLHIHTALLRLFSQLCTDLGVAHLCFRQQWDSSACSLAEKISPTWGNS